MLTLDGQYPRLSVAAAGRQYADAQKLLDEDIDPGVKVVEGKQAERDADTVKELAHQYIEYVKSPENPKTPAAWPHWEGRRR